MIYQISQYVVRAETADPQDEVQTLVHDVHTSACKASAYLARLISCSLSSNHLTPWQSLKAPDSCMLLGVHTCSSSARKALSAVHHLDVFIPGSLSLSLVSIWRASFAFQGKWLLPPGCSWLFLHYSTHHFMAQIRVGDLFFCQGPFKYL